MGCTGAMSVPVMYGMVQGTSTPQITVDEAKAMGINIIVYAAICLLPEYIYLTQALKTLRMTGFVEHYDNAPGAHEVFGTTFRKP